MIRPMPTIRRNVKNGMTTGGRSSGGNASSPTSFASHEPEAMKLPSYSAARPVHDSIRKFPIRAVESSSMRALARSSRPGRRGVYQALAEAKLHPDFTVSQNVRKLSTRFSGGLPAISAEFTAPIEMPATQGAGS